MASKPSLEKLRKKAEAGDVQFEISRWYGGKQTEEDACQLAEILQLGYCSEARNWLKSMQPEQMKFGKYTLGQRLSAARRFAEMAGTTLEEIARECGLEEMLSVSPEPEPDPLPRQ